MSTYSVREIQRLYRDDYELPESFNKIEGVYSKNKIIPRFLGGKANRSRGISTEFCDWYYQDDDGNIVGPVKGDVIYQEFRNNKLQNVTDKDKVLVGNRKEKSTFKSVEDLFLRKEFAFLFNPDLNKYIADIHSYANDGDPLHKILHSAESIGQ